MQPNDLISLIEASKLLPPIRRGKTVRVASLRRWIFAGKLSGWKLGGSWLVSRSEVLSLAQRREVPQVRPRIDRRGHEEAMRYLREHGYV